MRRQENLWREEEMCNLSEGIAKAAYKKGVHMVRFLILSSCVQDGKITLKEATAYSEMSIEEFTQR